MKRTIKEFTRDGGSRSTLYSCLVDGVRCNFLRREDMVYLDEEPIKIDGYRWYILDISIELISRRHRIAVEIDADLSFQLELEVDVLKEANDKRQYQKVLGWNNINRLKKARKGYQ